MICCSNPIPQFGTFQFSQSDEPICLFSLAASFLISQRAIWNVPIILTADKFDVKVIFRALPALDTRNHVGATSGSLALRGERKAVGSVRKVAPGRSSADTWRASAKAGGACAGKRVTVFALS
jgi:hypothetical protein